MISIVRSKIELGVELELNIWTLPRSVATLTRTPTMG